MKIISQSFQNNMCIFNIQRSQNKKLQVGDINNWKIWLANAKAQLGIAIS